MDEVRGYFNYEFGACIKEENRYLIVYDSRQDMRVQRFTLAHEYGHVKLDHFSILGEHGCLSFGKAAELSESEKAVEKEANCFARNFLAPLFFIEDYDNEFKLAALADISLTAAGVRLKSLETDLHNLKRALRSA